MIVAKLPKKLFPSVKKQMFFLPSRLMDIMIERENKLRDFREVCLFINPIMLHTYITEKVDFLIGNIPFTSISVNKYDYVFGRSMGFDFDGDVMSHYAHQTQLSPFMSYYTESSSYLKIHNKVVADFKVPNPNLGEIVNNKKYKDLLPSIKAINLINESLPKTINHHIYTIK
jgi:hypothetical protein